jgi:hypothetical protein
VLLDRTILPLEMVIPAALPLYPSRHIPKQTRVCPRVHPGVRQGPVVALTMVGTTNALVAVEAVPKEDKVATAAVATAVVAPMAVPAAIPIRLAPHANLSIRMWVRNLSRLPPPLVLRSVAVDIGIAAMAGLVIIPIAIHHPYRLLIEDLSVMALCISHQL